jgi:phosphoribosyl-ATP pyrophosphohydrolase/phosphoribosyl-AMP cyclohydrolase
MFDPDRLDFAKGDGLVTVVVQSAATGQVLMVAHADREAVERTIASHELHLRSRSRGPWHKGATSGNRQHVVSLSTDCDGDALLARVRPDGPACHTGTASCFADAPLGTLAALDAVIEARARDPEAGGYTRQLLGDRNLRLKKLGEEMSELVTACADGDRARAVEEAADLVYHSLVALRALGASLEDVEVELAARARLRTP